MNLLLIIFISSLALALVVFLIIRNKKDETSLENKLNNNYPKARDESGDHRIDDLTDSVH